MLLDSFEVRVGRRSASRRAAGGSRGRRAGGCRTAGGENCHDLGVDVLLDFVQVRLGHRVVDTLTQRFEVGLVLLTRGGLQCLVDVRDELHLCRVEGGRAAGDGGNDLDGIGLVRQRVDALLRRGDRALAISHALDGRIDCLGDLGGVAVIDVVGLERVLGVVDAELAAVGDAVEDRVGLRRQVGGLVIAVAGRADHHHRDGESEDNEQSDGAFLVLEARAPSDR